jgi:hypothetical protein
MDPNSRLGTALLLRRYAVSIDGEISYIEAFIEPGKFLAQRLNWRGLPLDSKVVRVKDLEAMKLFSNLREARATASVNAAAYKRYLEGKS